MSEKSSWLWADGVIPALTFCSTQYNLFQPLWTHISKYIWKITIANAIINMHDKYFITCQQGGYFPCTMTQWCFQQLQGTVISCWFCLPLLKLFKILRVSMYKYISYFWQHYQCMHLVHKMKNNIKVFLILFYLFKHSYVTIYHVNSFNFICHYDLLVLWSSFKFY